MSGRPVRGERESGERKTGETGDSESFHERLPKITFLFDLRINQFFGNGPPTLLS